jgi:hypothetical protein
MTARGASRDGVDACQSLQRGSAQHGPVEIAMERDVRRESHYRASHAVRAIGIGTGDVSAVAFALVAGAGFALVRQVG